MSTISYDKNDFYYIPISVQLLNSVGMAPEKCIKTREIGLQKERILEWNKGSRREPSLFAIGVFAFGSGGGNNLTAIHT